ncbi:MAG: hypothetical protein KDD61_07735 [Bdellovibrionales bacterium]|nr:hypothetical protein [Bdellovibrionales bacterium]
MSFIQSALFITVIAISQFAAATSIAPTSTTSQLASFQLSSDFPYQMSQPVNGGSVTIDHWNKSVVLSLYAPAAACDIGMMCIQALQQQIVTLPLVQVQVSECGRKFVAQQTRQVGVSVVVESLVVTDLSGDLSCEIESAYPTVVEYFYQTGNQAVGYSRFHGTQLRQFVQEPIFQ